MPSKLKVTIVSIDDSTDLSSAASGDKIVESTVFVQTFDSLDLSGIVLALNKRPRKSRANVKPTKQATS